MQVIHPQGMLNNFQPEDVFIAVDDMGTEIGHGYLIRQYQPHLYPDRPVNLYFTMESQPSAQYLLFGALVARARQVRDEYPKDCARVYTNIAPNDVARKDFFQRNGFSVDDTENLVSLTIPAGDGRIPMSCTVTPVPLNTPEELNAFVARLHQNDLTYISPEYVQSLRRNNHFLALALYRNTEMIGEALLAGMNDHAELAAIYITPPHRSQGMGAALLHRSMALMRVEGVQHITATLMTRSQPQTKLLNHFGMQTLTTVTVYPYLYL